MSPLLLALVIVQSTVYAWTDKSGVEHFTDDLKSIPRGVMVRTTQGAEISRIDSDLPINPRPATVTTAPSQPAFPSTSEQVWRQLFRDAKNKVTVLEEEIESDRRRVEEVNGLPVMAGFNCFPGYGQPGYFAQPIVTSGVVLSVGGQPFPGVAVGGTVTGGTTFLNPATQYYAAPCFYGFNPEFARIRERLEKNRHEIVRAREELADLERRASFEAVPLHWRR